MKFKVFIFLHYNIIYTSYNLKMGQGQQKPTISTKNNK